ILSWGFIIIGTVDDFLRAYLIKGKAEVNMVFVLFSIIGGIALFGFWGIVLGPLIVALAVTVFHIYELEFCNELSGCDNIEKELEVNRKDKSLKPDKFNIDKVDNNIIKKIVKFFRNKK
ncbi:MAG TPA: hypothetical protein VFD51_01580, partial [Patescibacteria group bacterium]|nr:hypothetical protein [Patescibacteria group bacterium]